MRPSKTTFLSIDAEGTDYDALRSIDWEKTKLTVICAEEWPGDRPVSEYETCWNATRMN
jgi:hypothetical protein